MKFVKENCIVNGVAILLLVSIGLFVPLHSVFAADYGDWKTWAGLGGCVVGGSIIGLFTLGWGMAVGGVCAAAVLGVAQAGINELGAKFLEIVIQPLFQLLVHLARYLVVFAGNMLDTVLSASFNEPAQIVNNNFVVEGWTLVRDFANMFFVLILVMIAFATIFQSETYGIKKALPRLIIVALLVNFSRVITGVFVDAAQIFMVFFFDSFPETSIGNMLANSMNLAQIGNAHWSELQIGALTEQIVTIIGLIITFFVYILAAFMFGLFAVLFIVRVIALWILIILAPLAFMAAILPITQGYFNTWVRNFTKWTFWGVTAGFFIYLALLLGDALKTMGFGGSNPDSGTIEGIAVAFMRYAALLVFLFIGLNIARTSTDRVGAIVSTKFEGAARRAVGIAAAPPRAAAGLAAARARREAERRAGVAAGKASGYAAQVARGERGIVSKIPLAGWAAKQMVEPLARFEARVGRDIDKEASEIAKLPDERARDIARTTTEPIKKIAAYIDMAKRGMLSEKYGFEDKEVGKVMTAAKTYFREKELAMAKPDVAKEVFKWSDDDLERHMAKYTKPTAARMAVEALDNEDIQKAIVKTWGNQQALGMVEEGNRDQIEAFEKAIRNMTKAAGNFNATMQMIETTYSNPRLAKSLSKNPALKVLYIR